MENVTEAVRSGAEKVQQMGSHVSYEANKSAAKNPNLTTGTRAGAAIDAIGDKINEGTHATKSEYHKQKAIH